MADKELTEEEAHQLFLERMADLEGVEVREATPEELERAGVAEPK